MLMFTLSISCLTTSNLPLFKDLMFQVPMQYCSLQHQTSLLSPVTSTTGCCFCFGSISSFFLELFLHWSPVAYWAPTNLGSSSFSVLYLFAFSYFHRVLKERILTWFAIPFFSGPHFLRTLHHEHFISCKTGTFHAKMGTTKDTNGMDLTEDIKKRWQEYTEELCKKDLHDSDNHDGMITHLEPDILECQVKWALGKHHYKKS